MNLSVSRCFLCAILRGRGTAATRGRAAGSLCRARLSQVRACLLLTPPRPNMRRAGAYAVCMPRVSRRSRPRHPLRRAPLLHLLLHRCSHRHRHQSSSSSRTRPLMIRPTPRSCLRSRQHHRPSGRPPLVSRSRPTARAVVLPCRRCRLPGWPPLPPAPSLSQQPPPAAQSRPPRHRANRVVVVVAAAAVVLGWDRSLCWTAEHRHGRAPRAARPAARGQQATPCGRPARPCGR
jgi:hypothetical protein